MPVLKNKSKFLGHVVGGCKRSPNLDKVEGICHMPEPVTKRQLKCFLGMCNFYRSFLPNYSEMVWPLTELTKAQLSSTIKFTSTEKAAFERVKSKLCKTVDLYSPDYTKPFIIRTDASMLGIGCSLSKKGNDD